MPEVVLRIAGTNAAAIRTIRETVAELHGVRIETEKIGAANREIQPSIAETARINVTKAIEQREALKGLVQEYATLAKAPGATAEEARVANRLWMESNQRLAATYDEVGVAAKRSASEAAAASARAREESGAARGVARGFASRTFGLSAFAGGAFIAGAAAGVIIKKAADEAQRAQESQAQLRNALDRTGQSWDAQGASIDRYLVRAEKASSFDRIDLRTSLGQLIRTTGDTAKAQDLLSQATDVARGRHISLDTAVRLVTRAYQGSVGSLARLGIHIAAVTTAQDALRAANVKATPEMTRQAKELDRQATATAALKRLNDLYSGSAEAHARTLAGHEEALKNALTDVSVAIGQAVTPALSRMFEWMAKTIEAATTSKTVHTVLRDVFHALGQVVSAVVGDFDILRGTFEFISHHLLPTLIPLLAVGLVAALVAVRWGLISISESMPWTALIVGAALAAGWVVRHWSTVKGWFNDFWGYMKDTARAAWAFIVDLAKGAVYVILEEATAVVRGVLEIASHLPFVGDKARAALNSINDYLNKWKPDFGNVVKAFGAGGTSAGDAFATAAQQAMSKAANTAAATGGTVLRRGGTIITAGRGGGQVFASAGRGGGFVPSGSTFQKGRVDQGQDFQTDPGGPIIAPGDGVCTGIHSDPSGFGPDYPTVHFTSGPYAGHTMYIGHTHSALRMGERFRKGQVIAHTGFTGVGNATVPGWAEIGYWGASGPVPGFTIGGTSRSGRPAPTTTPTIQQIIASGQPKPTTTAGGPSGLAALGVPQSLQDRIARAAARGTAAHGEAAADWLETERSLMEQAIRDLRRKLHDPSLTAKQRDAIHKQITSYEDKITRIGTEIAKALVVTGDALLPKDIQRRVTDAAGRAKAAIASAQAATGTDVTAYYATAAAALTDEENAIKQEVARLRTRLGHASAPQKVAIRAEIKKLESSVASVASAVTSALNQEANAVQSTVSGLQSTVGSAWSSVSQGIVSAFEATTQSMIDAVAKQFFQGGQTPEEAALAAVQASDQVQSLQDAVAQAATPADRAAAQHQLDLYNLEQAATASRTKADADYAAAVKKIQTDRTNEEEHLTVALGQFGDGLSTGTKSFSDLQPLLTQYGVNLGAISDGSFTFKTNLDLLYASSTALDTAFRDLAVLIGKITGKPVHLPPAVGAAPPSASGTHSTPSTGVGVGGHFATGGIVPGPMIGPEDTVTARVSTGEGVLSRDEMRLLLTAAIGGRTATPISQRPIYVLGATKDEVGRALARIITPAQRRTVGFKDY